MFFAGRALCYSALLLLYHVHCCVETDEIECCGGNRGLRLDLQQMALDGGKIVSIEVHAFSAELEQAYSRDPDSTSPLVTNCLYSAARNFACMFVSPVVKSI